MKSGKRFHESCNDVYVKAYCDEMAKMKCGSVLKYTKPEVDAMLPPHLWEYSKTPWIFGLSMKATPTKSWQLVSRFAGTWSFLNSKRNLELVPPVNSPIQFIGA
jgi:hypothetical protein